MHQISHLSPHHRTNPLNDSIKSILLKGIKSIVLKVLQAEPQAYMPTSFYCTC